MKIELARHSGFCMGVRNAILKIINEINSSEKDIYVYGPLIHNPQTINVLDNRGLKTVNSLENTDNKQIAIRTHGIPINENRYIKKRAKRIINLTCPRVARVQSIIKKFSNEGYFTIIIGDHKHAEVIGLKSYAAEGVVVISDTDEIKYIPNVKKYLLVAQTTLDSKLYTRIVDILKSKFDNIVIIDTICDSTTFRQNAVIDGIKKGIDTLVVVGGKNSANTKRLAHIGIDNNINTIYIETENEMDESDFKDSGYVLVTAGASTPGWIINNVLEKLYKIKFKKTNIIINSIKNLLEFIVRSNLLSAIAAFYMTSIVQFYCGAEINYNYSLISFFYIFSMYSINNYFDRDFLKACNSYKYFIYERYGIPLLILSLFFMFISISISLNIDLSASLVLIFTYVFGFAYSTRAVKNIVRAIRIPFLRKIYNSKIITSFGWLIITAILPVINLNFKTLDFVSISIFVLVLTFVRHMLIDMIAFQGDLIFGRETLPILIGIKNINLLSISLSIIPILLLTVNSFITQNFFPLVFSVNIFYYIFLLSKIRKVNYLISLKYEILVDFNYILIILFTYLYL